MHCTVYNTAPSIASYILNAQNALCNIDYTLCQPIFACNFVDLEHSHDCAPDFICLSNFFFLMMYHLIYPINCLISAFYSVKKKL